MRSHRAEAAGDAGLRQELHAFDEPEPRRLAPRPASTGETVRKSSSTSWEATARRRRRAGSRRGSPGSRGSRSSASAAARSTASPSLTATTSVAAGTDARRSGAARSVVRTSAPGSSTGCAGSNEPPAREDRDAAAARPGRAARAARRTPRRPAGYDALGAPRPLRRGEQRPGADEDASAHARRSASTKRSGLALVAEQRVRARAAREPRRRRRATRRSSRRGTAPRGRARRRRAGASSSGSSQRGRSSSSARTAQRIDQPREREELAPQRLVLVVQAAPDRRDRDGAVLLDAAHRGAEVRRLEPTATPRAPVELAQPVGDLLGDPLLHREPPRVEPHEPRQLGDAEDLVAGDVADVRAAVERQRVVLAERVEADRALDDLGMRALDAGGPLGREERAQLRVAVVARRRVVERAQEALRRVARARRVEVEAERLEDLGRVPLEPRPVARRSARARWPRRRGAGARRRSCSRGLLGDGRAGGEEGERNDGELAQRDPGEDSRMPERDAEPERRRAGSTCRGSRARRPSAAWSSDGRRGGEPLRQPVLRRVEDAVDAPQQRRSRAAARPAPRSRRSRRARGVEVEAEHAS